MKRKEKKKHFYTFVAWRTAHLFIWLSYCNNIMATCQKDKLLQAIWIQSISLFSFISFVMIWLSSSNWYSIHIANKERSTQCVAVFTAHLAPPPPFLWSAIQVSHDWAVPRAAVGGIYIQLTLMAKRRRSTFVKLYHTLFILSTSTTPHI